MSFTIYILLTNVGSQAGPFDLYSDVDNYAVPFDTNVPKSALTQYYSASVPDGTESIRVKSLGDCVNFIDISIANLPTPSVTPTNTPTVTPTCPVTTQYLEATLQSCKAFKLALWNDAGLTSAANANCNYIISGTAYGDLGTVYTGQETILSGQHQHNFNLNPVLLPGECVSGFTVHSYTLSGCACPVNLILPTPSVTPTSTPTMTPTVTLTPSVSPTQGLTPTPSVTPSITPTLTVTPTLTTTPASCLCYLLDNATSTGGDYTYQKCGEAFLTVESLPAFSSVQICSQDLPTADPNISITPCGLSCTQDSDCLACL